MRPLKVAPVNDNDPVVVDCPTIRSLRQQLAIHRLELARLEAAFKSLDEDGNGPPSGTYEADAYHNAGMAVLVHNETNVWPLEEKLEVAIAAAVEARSQSRSEILEALSFATLRCIRTRRLAPLGDLLESLVRGV